MQVVSPLEVSIGDTSGFDNYIGGGVMCQLQRRRKLQFQSLEEQLCRPTCMIVDYAKPLSPMHTIVGTLAYHRYVTEVLSLLQFFAFYSFIELLLHFASPILARPSSSSLVSGGCK